MGKAWARWDDKRRAEMDVPFFKKILPDKICPALPDELRQLGKPGKLSESFLQALVAERNPHAYPLLSARLLAYNL